MGKQLDKDVLFPGNKLYSPETCVFVDARVNSFLVDAGARRGEYPIGVSFRKERGKFEAKCNDVLSGKLKYLGYFDNAEQAHDAWLSYKLEQAKILASEQSDYRVAKALVMRYTNYQQN